MINIHVQLNDTQIGSVEIHRLEGGSHPADVNVYEATFEWVEMGDWRKQRRHVSFHHTYGEPWPAMLYAALDALRLTGAVR
ncbi:hypothetical protein [Mycolicibacterium vaccae]|uniref:hypothetical protein n=1 Tax=Mycolicibacterium vaccae TaxID=1810 RepID=UPI003CFD41B7